MVSAAAFELCHCLWKATQKICKFMGYFINRSWQQAVFVLRTTVCGALLYTTAAFLTALLRHFVSACRPPFFPPCPAAAILIFFPLPFPAQTVKSLPVMQETQVQSMGQEDLLEELTTHSSILAWRIPWTEEPGGLHSMGSQRVWHHWATNTIFKHPSFILLQGLCPCFFLFLESSFPSSGFNSNKTFKKGYLNMYSPQQICIPSPFIVFMCVSCSVMSNSFATPLGIACQSLVHGILQARILGSVAISFSRGFSWPRDRTLVSCVADRFFTVWATGKPSSWWEVAV